MDKRISSYISSFLNFTERNTPTILTTFGVLGVFETGILAYRAGTKGKAIMDAKRKDLEDVHPKDKVAKRAVMGEMAKEMAPVIAPPVLMGTATAACIIGSNRVSSRRIAAISAAYSLTETALKEYKEKTREVLGERKTQQIREAIAKDKVEQTPPTTDMTPLLVGTDDVLCMDGYTRRVFYSNKQKIGAAINRLNYECRNGMYVSLNELWAEINAVGLDPLPIGNDLGWNIDDCVRGELPITTTAVLTPDGRPCLCVDYDVYLVRDFRNLH